jgi:hypothetical protein
VAQALQIYDWFTRDLLSESEIAQRLNAAGVRTAVAFGLARKLRSAGAQQIPSTSGLNVYNRRSFKLKKQRVVNPPHMWIRKTITPLSRSLMRARFKAAAARLIERSKRYSDEEMLDRLRTANRTHGYLSGLLINEAPDTPSSAAYRNRFGSLTRAWNQPVGYEQGRDLHYLAVNRSATARHAPEDRRKRRPRRSKQWAGSRWSRTPSTQPLTVNGEFHAPLGACALSR